MTSMEVVPDANSQALVHKQAGNDAFGQNNYLKAIECYTNSLQSGGDRDAALAVVLYSNRAECWLKLGEPDNAISDCTAALQLDATHAKSSARLERARKMQLENRLQAQQREILSAAPRPDYRIVFIPSDSDLPIEEIVLSQPIDDVEGQVQCLMNFVKERFLAMHGEPSGDTSGAQINEILRKSGADSGAPLDPRLVAAAQSLGYSQLVDVVPLLMHTRSSGFVGVNLYADDGGSGKGLPVNRRASQIASACGQQKQILGSCFIARVFDNDDEFRRLDFTKQDLSSDAEWVRLARSFVAKR
eukprot:gnl/Spiro4/2_TR3_c0_g1_i1.p1 gnl/Spiro4/2_TR3_c0_g1~~gnl/Spiro4/2_TR3_c0_g1_i1.p1  ORF type:complete len:310 (-),score=61.12 gnl/Spiro4/2_TR3_c0_g1_i1:10-915(-)